MHDPENERLPASNMIEKLYRMIATLPERENDKPISSVISKLPPGHQVHALMATAIRCDVCGWAGFLSQGYVAIGEGTFHCPACDQAETLFVIEASASTQ